MKKLKPQVPPMYLLILAGLAWGYAGAKVLQKGIPKLVDNWEIPAVNIAISLIVFFVFLKFIFLRMHKKHRNRIMAYKENVNIFLFFDHKSYIIMAFMITLGILFTHLTFIPPIYIGTFYLGLGSALFTAGICFLVSFFLEFYQSKIEKSDKSK